MRRILSLCGYIFALLKNVNQFHLGETLKSLILQAVKT
jgi:hypothetical protein